MGQRTVAPGDVLLDRYRIAEWIGSGSSGLVMRAVDLAQSRVVAVKIRHGHAEGSRKDNSRFLREIQAISALRGPHVAQLFDFGALPDGTPYMVMEFLEGPDLRKVLASNGRLDPRHAVDYILQACDALVEAHALGIVHRDIKPANLMLAKHADGRQIVKVVDFGSAKAPGMDLTRSGSLVGTPLYMSPEQMHGARGVDLRCDIWSIGAVLYHLVEGRPPFDAQHFMDLAAQVSSAQQAAMVVAPELAPVVERCLKKRPRDRFTNIRDLARALAPFASRPSGLAIAQVPVRSARSRPGRDLLVFIGVFVIVCGMTLAILAFAN